MPASPINALTDRRVLNSIVNMRIKPYTALYNMLFPPSTRETLFEEYVQVDVLTGTPGMAPFVKIGQKAVMVDSMNGTSYTIETPFINIKRPLTYSTRLAKRIVGGNVFVNKPGQLIQVIKEEITKDVDYMNSLIDNRLEWMAAKMLIGTVEYSVEGNDSFTISTGKPGDNTVTAASYWNTTCTPHEDIRSVKAVVAAVRGPIPDTAICGATAAAALRTLILAGTLKLDTTSGIDIGKMNLLSRIQEDGMIYMGRFCDVDFFEYLGSYPDDTTGVDTALIRTNYIEFFSRSQSSVSMRNMFFGLIPDLKAILDGAARTERYMTSKAPDEDQGTYEGIIKSRPFPWFKRPDWQVSLKVLA